MSSIINALFGSNKDKDDKKHAEKSDTTTSTLVSNVGTSPVISASGVTTTSAGSATGSSVSHTAISDDVRVHSVVSSESNTSVSMQNSKKISDLMSKLGTTHNQVDEYSKKRTTEISDAVSSAIQKVVADTAEQQQLLLTDANQRSATIELQYKQRLQERVCQLDSEKAVLLAELERTLNERQEAILSRARQHIDSVQNAANEEKMAVFKEAQTRANQQVDQITGKVAELAAEDASRRLQSTTQTVITTKSVASGETHVPAANVAAGSATTTTTRSSESHHSSSSNH